MRERDKTWWKREKEALTTKWTDGSEFHKKQKSDRDLKMFENWVKAFYDASLITKIKKSSIINSLKRSYLISKSPRWRTAFNWEINTVQWCACSDFAKNWHRVLCKHILFIVLHLIDGKDLEPPLRMRFLEENNLWSLFDAAGENMKHQLLPEQPTGRRKDFHAIFAIQACFTQPQTSKVQKKYKMYKQFLQKVINVGTEYIVSKVLQRYLSVKTRSSLKNSITA